MLHSLLIAVEGEPPRSQPTALYGERSAFQGAGPPTDRIASPRLRPAAGRAADRRLVLILVLAVLPELAPNLLSPPTSGFSPDLQLEIERLRAERDALAAELQIERAERLRAEERLRLFEREKLEQMREGAASREKLASELEEARLRAMRAEARQAALDADLRLSEIAERAPRWPCPEAGCDRRVAARSAEPEPTRRRWSDEPEPARPGARPRRPDPPRVDGGATCFQVQPVVARRFGRRAASPQRLPAPRAPRRYARDGRRGGRR